MGQREKGGGPTLANDRERRAYAEDPANWNEVAEIQAGGYYSTLLIERLGGTPFVRVSGRIEEPYFDYGYWAEDSGPEFSWYKLGIYEIVPETGALKTVYSLSIAQVAQRLKELGI